MNNYSDKGYFYELGNRLNGWLSGDYKWDSLTDALHNSFCDNPFFTPYMQTFALASICEDFLVPDKLDKWLNKYDLRNKKNKSAVCGVVAAGNIPVVCFHDILCVLLSGVTPIVKLSSKDKYLLPVLFPDLYYTNTLPLTGMDGVITMGGDAAARFYEDNYSNMKRLIRGSRFSCAVLRGSEDVYEMSRLCEDILIYYGLGCRSVSCLLVPEDYSFEVLGQCANDFLSQVGGDAFNDNYLRSRAIVSLDGGKFYDSGRLIFMETDNFNDLPIGVVGVKRYASEVELDNFFHQNKGQIQKIYTNFGTAQRVSLDDYPDGKDTMEFLLGLLI